MARRTGRSNADLTAWKPDLGARGSLTWVPVGTGERDAPIAPLLRSGKLRLASEILLVLPSEPTEDATFRMVTMAPGMQ